MTRRPELDALRGLMLVLMTVTHLPTRLSEAVSQPAGFVSAAEGFVFLSAFMAGMVYGHRALRSGLPAMQRAFVQRAVKIYLCQASLLVFLFTTIAAIGVAVRQPAITDLISFFLKEPHVALWSSLALIYNPPLLDILPLYVLFMLVSPLVLTYALTRGWHGILICSLALWAATQFGISQVLYGWLVALTGLSVPFQETGAFETFGWQFLWIAGLWLGTTQVTSPGTFRDIPRWLLATCVVIAIVGFAGRHIVGQVVPDEFLNRLLDKWHLGPLRLLNFCALLILVARYGKSLRQLTQPGDFLQTLGAASLPVFCGHLVIVLLALALVGPDRTHGAGTDALLLIGSFAALYGIAYASKLMDARKRLASPAKARGTGRSIGDAPG